MVLSMSAFYVLQQGGALIQPADGFVRITIILILDSINSMLQDPKKCFNAIRIASSMPTFNMAEYFEGRTRAWGLFETVTGKVKKSFVADIEGRWDDDDFLLEEDFTFSDGEKETRTWRLQFNDDGSFGPAAPIRRRPEKASSKTCVVT